MKHVLSLGPTTDRRSYVSRADLLRAFLGGKDADESQRLLTSTAQLSGYSFGAASTHKTEDADVPFPELPKASILKNPSAPPAAKTPGDWADVPIWIVVRRERFTTPPRDSEATPRPSVEASDYQCCGEDPHTSNLLNRRDLDRVLNRLLRMRRSVGGIDVAQIVTAVSRRRILERWPPVQRRASARRVTVVCDSSDRLIPIFEDQMKVVARLIRRIGKPAVSLRNFEDGIEFERRLPSTASTDGKNDDDFLLFLGDLGADGSRNERRAWARLGRSLRRSKRSFAALVASGGASRSVAIAAFPHAKWDRRPAPSSAQAISDDARYLLRLLSTATFIQPGLLRAVRMIVRRGRIGIDAEIEAWNALDRANAAVGAMDDESRNDLLSELVRDLTGPDAESVRNDWVGTLAILGVWRKSDPRLVGAEESLAALSVATAAGRPELVDPEIVKSSLATFDRIARAVETAAVPASIAEFFRRHCGRSAHRLGTAPMTCDAAEQVVRRLNAAFHRPDARTPAIPFNLRVMPTGIYMAGALPHGDLRSVIRDSSFTLFPGESMVLRRRSRAKAQWIPFESKEWTRIAGLHEESLIVKSPRESLEVAQHSRRANFPWANRFAIDDIGPFIEVGEFPELIRFRPTDAWRTEAGVEVTELVWKVDSPGRLPWMSDIGVDRLGVWADVEIAPSEFAGRTAVQRFRWIPPGEFLMGSPSTEVSRSSDEVQHEVELSRGYWLADTPCTQAFYEAVTGANPSRYKGDDRPVEMVSWHDAMAMIEKLNRLCPGLDARLPTEAEWEYACRAGDGRATYAGDLVGNEAGDRAVLDRIAWYSGNRGGEATRPVRQKDANDWGLYDTLGNVWEWCADWYGAYPTERVVDPAGPEGGAGRVYRGGSWDSDAQVVRAADRYGWYVPVGHRDFLGFRLARGQRIELPAAEPKKTKAGKPKVKVPPLPPSVKSPAGQ